MTVPFLDVAATYAELKTELDAACARVLSSGQYVLGEEVARFERDFAEYCGSASAIGVGNGLEALEIVFRGYGIGPGDEVIVPAHTYIATWLAVSRTGARPVPVDGDPQTSMLTAQLVENALTSRTKAIVVVHLYGVPTPMDEIVALAGRRGIPVVEDAAQAHGARWHGRRTGSLGHAAGWSFYPGKNLGAFGDGGAITTDDAGLGEAVRALRNYGSRVKYVNDLQGVNSRLDPLHAACLGVKLRCLDEWNQRRQKVAARYLEALRGIDGLRLPHVPAGADPSWHLFVVAHVRRDSLREHLERSGIATLIHYPIPPHLSGAYSDRQWVRGAFPVAESMAGTVLSLPIGPHLTGDDVERVIRAVQAWGTRQS